MLSRRWNLAAASPRALLNKSSSASCHLDGGFKSEVAAERFQPVCLRQVIVDQTETKGSKFWFGDAQQNLLGSLRQIRSEDLKRARQFKSDAELRAQTFLKLRKRHSQIVQSSSEGFDELRCLFAAGALGRDGLETARFGQVGEKQRRRFPRVEDGIPDR